VTCKDCEALRRELRERAEALDWLHEAAVKMWRELVLREYLRCRFEMTSKEAIEEARKAVNEKFGLTGGWEPNDPQV